MDPLTAAQRQWEQTQRAVTIAVIKTGVSRSDAADSRLDAPRLALVSYQVLSKWKSSRSNCGS